MVTIEHKDWDNDWISDPWDTFNRSDARCIGIEFPTSRNFINELGQGLWCLSWYIRDPAMKPLFSDSKELKRPHMCYIFEKHGIQGYQIYIKCKIHKYTNTLIHKYKVLKRPNMCYIFEKLVWSSYHIISSYHLLHLHLQIDGAYSRSIECHFSSPR